MSYKVLVSLCFASLLSACGGSDSDDDSFLGSNSFSNFALTQFGSSVTANYDPDSAEFVIDGSKNTSEAWSGIAIGDYLTIDLGQDRSIKKINLYSSENENSDIRKIELSNNNLSWKTTFKTEVVQIPCFSVTSTSSRVSCNFSSAVSARYLRFTTLTSSPLNVFEIEIQGN